MKGYLVSVGLLALAFGLAGCSNPLGSAAEGSAATRAASDSARLALGSLVQNVAGAQGKVYNATDSAGHTMDCLKIIANPGVAGQFIGVYHCYFNNGATAYVCLATSTDLLHWTFVRTLAGTGGANASQPTILAVGSGFMLAWEQEPSNHIKLAYYASWSALQGGSPSNTFDAPRQLSAQAEGTPNLYAATATSADVGFHYYKNGSVDRQARGQMTNWNTWTSSAQTTIDNAMLYYGVNGNIGDRDNLSYGGSNFLLSEAGGDNSNFGSWRVFVYDPQTGNSDKLSIRTNGGSKAFANPTATVLTLNGQQVLVCTLFVPTENSAAGEKGELIYYSPVGSGFSRKYEAESAPMQHNIGRLDGAGWSASTNLDAAGTLVYGPYAADIPAGARSAVFQMKVDVITGTNDTVANLDVYDATAGTVLASLAVKRADFLKANCFDVFRLNFTNPASHQLEFRAGWTKKAYLNADSIVIF